MSPSGLFAYPSVDPQHVRATARELRYLADRSMDAARVLRAEADSLAIGWKGPAFVACHQEMGAASSLTQRLGPPLRTASILLLRFAKAVVVARQRVDRLRLDYAEDLARHSAEASRIFAQADWTPLMQHLRLEALEDEQRRQQAIFHRRHQEVLDELRVTAVATGVALQSVAAELVPGGVRPGQRPADAEAALAVALPMLFAQRSLLSRGVGVPPPHGTSAKVVRAWWALLTTDERDRLIANHAHAIGRLDGLPAAARSSANERVLTRMVARLQKEAHPTPLGVRRLANAVLVQRRLVELRRRTDPVTGRPVVVQLVVFEPGAFAGEGRAALAVGDLDTSDHVAYLVPGTGSNLDKTWQALTGDAHRVARLARETAPGSTTAVVAWMGYDAPTVENVAVDNAAENGADRLLSDVAAMRASRAVAAHVTVVAHSYGSTTAGEALQRQMKGIGDVVLIGSPGAGVDHARDLHVPPGHVYVGANSSDPVSYLDWFGKDPTHESFGATRFVAEDPTSNVYRLDFDDHSKYYRAGSVSLRNIVNVVVSNYDEVTRADYRKEDLLLPDGIDTDPERDRPPTTVRCG